MCHENRPFICKYFRRTQFIKREHSGALFILNFITFFVKYSLLVSFVLWIFIIKLREGIF